MGSMHRKWHSRDVCSSAVSIGCSYPTAVLSRQHYCHKTAKPSTADGTIGARRVVTFPSKKDAVDAVLDPDHLAGLRAVVG